MAIKVWVFVICSVELYRHGSLHSEDPCLGWKVNLTLYATRVVAVILYGGNLKYGVQILFSVFESSRE